VKRAVNEMYQMLILFYAEYLVFAEVRLRTVAALRL